MNESQQGEAISFLHKKIANINIVLHQLKKKYERKLNVKN